MVIDIANYILHIIYYILYHILYIAIVMLTHVCGPHIRNSRCNSPHWCPHHHGRPNPRPKGAVNTGDQGKGTCNVVQIILSLSLPLSLYI